MFAIAIHGGIPHMEKEELSPEREKSYLKALKAALDAGYEVLSKRGMALDAVQAAVVSLEDNELFNAGKGSAFTADGTHELEASIMDGKRVDAGAVCGVRNVRNPILLARSILENSNHLFLNGKGAEKFAEEIGLQFEPDDYFFTLERYAMLQGARLRKVKSTGTVGAVAIDEQGNLASATSTGGLTNKNYGRIGDTPIIGAGTYAKNSTCAVSCTGTGEYFIRSVAAYDISALIEYGNKSLKAACEKVILKKVMELGGDGGVIAIDRHGNIEIVFNTPGMYRGYRKSSDEPVVSVF
jgi:beta-aspartyl-peptidase (threonine type)